MSEPLALSLGQKFELERMNRAIDSTGDTQSLRGLAKQLLHAWQSQRAATEWMMRQQLAAPVGSTATAAATIRAQQNSSPESPTDESGGRRPFRATDVL